MRFLFAALIALIPSAVTVPTVFTPLHQTTLALRLQKATDHYLFNVTIDQFIAARNAQDGTSMGLNWTSNGCSVAPDDPFGFDFLKACTRHDFGYRNYKQQRRCESAHKKVLDLNFRNDMYTQCAKERDERTRDACENVAALYYSSVKIFGTLLSQFCNFDF